MDAANILKPALGRGEIRVIGATTLEEYRKYIEKDAALERRFQSVQVPEPDGDKALAILRGLRPRYEAHHSLTISDDALLAAVTLSKRYLPDRFLPDKAIDLVDEAAAELLAEKGNDPAYGARPLRRLICSEVEDALASLLLDGTLARGDTAELTAENGALRVRRREKEALAALSAPDGDGNGAEV